MKNVFILCLISGLILSGCTANKFASGDALLNEGDTAGALAAYRALTETDPANAELFTRIGDIHLKSGDIDNAFEAFSQAVSIDKNHTEALEKLENLYILKAERYTQNGDNGSAAAFLTDAIAKYPQFSNLYEPAAEQQTITGNYAKAKEFLEKAISLNPENKSAATSLEEVNFITSSEGEKYFEALDYYKIDMFYETNELLKGLDEKTLKFKEVQYLKYLSEGRHFLKRGKVMQLWEAIESFGLANSIKPKEVEPLFYMAKAYEKKDKDKIAQTIEAYENVIKLAPESKYALESQVIVKALKIRKAKLDKFKKKGGKPSV